jgi:hypothetical protein
MSTITHDNLLKRFSYCAVRGRFFYLCTTSMKVKSGDVAGGKQNTGYRSLQIDGKRYLEHRLAWFYCTGAWPVGQVDHLNRDKTDNRIANLREASAAQNRRNRDVKGYRVKGSRFQARAWRNGVLHSLGWFDTKQEAVACFLTATAGDYSYTAV